MSKLKIHAQKWDNSKSDFVDTGAVDFLDHDPGCSSVNIDGTSWRIEREGKPVRRKLSTLDAPLTDAEFQFALRTPFQQLNDDEIDGAFWRELKREAAESTRLNQRRDAIVSAAEFLKSNGIRLGNLGFGQLAAQLQRAIANVETADPELIERLSLQCRGALVEVGRI